MKLKFLGILAFLAFVLGSCREFKEVQVTDVKSFRLVKASTEGIEAEVIVGIKNPNSYGFSIYPSDFDVVLSGIRLGKAKLYKRVHIAGNSEKSYVFKLKTSLKDINFMDVTNLLSSSKRSNIELNGNLKAGKFYLKKRFPVNYKEKIDLSGAGY